MDTVFDHIDVQTIIQDSFAQPTDLSIGLCLVDDEQIPVDVRTRSIASSEFLTALTGTPLAWATTYFGQSKRPRTLKFGRWVSAAIAAYFVGEELTVDPATVELISDGSFKIAVEGINAGAATEVASIDFDGDEDYGDIIATLNAALVASTDYADYAFELDALGKLKIQYAADTGASSAAVVITAGATGTDLTTAALLNLVDGTAVDGMDAETLLAAMQAVEAIDPDWYIIGTVGGSTVQKVALSAAINAMRKMAILVESSTDAYGAATETDLGFQVAALAHGRTVTMYDETASEYPDAALMGTMLPRREGVEDWAWQRLRNVTASSASGLTPAQKAVLKTKKYAWLETVAGITYCPSVFVSSGTEARIVRGADWFNVGITTDIFNAHINSELFAFDAQTIGIIVGIVTRYCTEAIARRIGVDTAARPLVINAPDPDDYTATERASHEMTMVNLFTLHLNSAVHDIVIDGTWTLN